MKKREEAGEDEDGDGEKKKGRKSRRSMRASETTRGKERREKKRERERQRVPCLQNKVERYMPFSAVERRMVRYAGRGMVSYGSVSMVSMVCTPYRIRGLPGLSWKKQEDDEEEER